MKIDRNKEICALVKLLFNNSPELLEMICSLPYIDTINNFFNFEDWLSKIKDATVGNYTNERINIYPINQPSDKYPSYISCQKYKFPNPTIGWNIIVGMPLPKSYISNHFPQLEYCYDENFMAQLIYTCKSKDFKNLLNFI